MTDNVPMKQIFAVSYSLSMKPCQAYELVYLLESMSSKVIFQFDPLANWENYILSRTKIILFFN